MEKAQNKRTFLNITIPKLDWYTIFVCMIWAQGILSDYVRAVFMRLPILKINDGHLAITVLYVIALVLALPQILKYLKGLKVMLPLVFAVAYVLTSIIFPENAVYIQQFAGTIFLTVLPMFYLGLAWDSDKLSKTLYYVSIISLLCAVVYKIFIGESMDASQSRFEGDMSFAYAVLPHVCLVAYYAFTKSNIWNVALTGIGSVFLLSLGTRGAVLCLFVFLALAVLFLTRSKMKMFIILLIGLLLLILLTGNRLVIVLTAFEELAENLGLSIRIVDQFNAGTLFESKGRDFIRGQLWEALRGHEVWGYGFFGDRVVLEGGFSHNFVMELLIDFGFLAAMIIMIVISVMLLMKFRKSNRNGKMFLLLFFCISIVQLMLSGSYLVEPNFFLLLGFCCQSKLSSTERLMKNS